MVNGDTITPTFINKFLILSTIMMIIVFIAMLMKRIIRETMIIMARIDNHRKSLLKFC